MTSQKLFATRFRWRRKRGTHKPVIGHCLAANDVGVGINAGAVMRSSTPIDQRDEAEAFRRGYMTTFYR